MIKITENTFYRHLLCLCPILLLCGMIYSNTFHVPFMFDGNDNIRQNVHIRINDLSPSSLYDAAFRSLHGARPVANISFALNYYFTGYDVTAWHLTNIIIHAVNGVLVYFLVLLTTGIITLKTDVRPGQDDNARLLALFAACLFVVHPIQTQAVTYIVQRMSSLAALFYFLSLLLYVLGRLRKETEIKIMFWVAGLVSGLLAMGCKQTAATLPVTIVLYEWFFFRDMSKQWVINNLKYLFIIFPVLVAIALIYLGDSPLERILMDYRYREFSMMERVLTEFRVVVFYISLLILPLPSRLNLLHEFDISRSLLDPFTTLLSLLVLTGLFFSAIILAKKHRIIAFGILWFFINLAIESSIIGLEIIYEHRLYLPMFGFVILIVAVLQQLLFGKRLAYPVCMVAIIIAMAGMTYKRNMDWQSETVLWSDVVAKSPHSYRASFNLGRSYQNSGDFDKAAEQYLNTIRIKPSHFGAYNNLGVINIKNENYLNAVTYLSEAISVDPGNADAYANMGVALQNLKQPDDAVAYYRKAVMVNPRHSKAHYLLGRILRESGDFRQAKIHYERSIRLNNRQPVAHNELGVILVGEGQLDSATSHFRRAIRINPDFVLPYLNLAYVERLLGNNKSACENLRKSLQLRPTLKSAGDDFDRYCQ